MNIKKCLLQISYIITLSVFLVGCSQFFPEPTPTPTATATATQTDTPTIIPTSTNTLSPSPTFTLPPTFPPAAPTLNTPITTSVNTPTPIVTSTPGVGHIKPNPGAKLKGYFDGGEIVFSINPTGDAVINLRFKVRCFGADRTVNFSRAAIKIQNSSFSYGVEDAYVQGLFDSPTSANGSFTIVLTEGKETCSYNYVAWTAFER